MTWKPKDIVVSDAEIDRFQKRLIRQSGFHYREALAAFLEGKLPELIPLPDGIVGYGFEKGHNAAVEAVAKGGAR